MPTGRSPQRHRSRLQQPRAASPVLGKPSLTGSAADRRLLACGGRASIFRSRLRTQGSACTRSRACTQPQRSGRYAVATLQGDSSCNHADQGSSDGRTMRRAASTPSAAAAASASAATMWTAKRAHRALKIILDGAGGGGELDTERHCARSGVHHLGKSSGRWSEVRPC